MQHIFIEPHFFQSETATIHGVNHLHLARVLRAKVGDEVVLLDGKGNAFRAVLVSIEKDRTQARLIESVQLPPEPSIHLTIAQAMVKGDKLEQVIQHGTEVGAGGFLPIQAERSVVDVPAEKRIGRVTRWQQIARSAAEQSKRAIVPLVVAPSSFTELCTIIQERGSPQCLGLLLHPDVSAEPLARVLRSVHTTNMDTQEIVLAIGPEGGWSPREVSQAQEAQMRLVILGPRILRTETAALVAISQILYHLETLR